MLAQAQQLTPLPIQKTIAMAPPRLAALGPILILCLFVLAGLIWLAIGGAVMRGAPAPRTKPLLQSRLADFQAIVAD